MKNNTRSKSRISSKAAKTEFSELVLLIEKIAGRLEVLERKTDLVLSRVSSAPLEKPERSNPVLPQPKNFLSSPQSELPRRPVENKPVPGPVHGRREKVLHKAVCADCHRDCEVPFKPTGERPVYCNECFSKRKNGHRSQVPGGQGAPVPVPEVPPRLESPQRKVVVTKKGVGKVTVSEIVRPSSREGSSKGRSTKPAKKSKK